MRSAKKRVNSTVAIETTNVMPPPKLVGGGMVKPSGAIWSNSLEVRKLVTTALRSLAMATLMSSGMETTGFSPAKQTLSISQEFGKHIHGTVRDMPSFGSLAVGRDCLLSLVGGK